ncbi:MAG: hypothetical protein KTR31_36580 [Myxococcales bacterium]|nr:hypothetical protein [Myxococcales bacterium]
MTAHRLILWATASALVGCELDTPDGPDPRPEPGPWDPFVMTYDIGSDTAVETCADREVPLEPRDVEAGASWEIDGVWALLYEISEDGYAADAAGDGCIILAPAGLRLDLTTLPCGYDTVRLSLTDGCRQGCTTVKTVANGAITHTVQTDAIGDHTIVIADAQPLDSLLIESNEGIVCPVQLTSSEAAP